MFIFFSQLFHWPVVSLLLLSLIFSTTGCLGFRYNVGTKSLFGQDIQTVSVPIFQSSEVSPELSERLTEAVCKRIEMRSPYKVVSSAKADSVLEGEIVSNRRSVSIVNNYSDPRQMTDLLVVKVRWKDRRNRDLQQFDRISWNNRDGTISSTNYMVAEQGQSTVTAEQEQIERIADQIVGMMEVPW
ncbi:MAG: LPS assembly lipoprotein LptE [Thermoguttaceae bacterium]